METLNNITAQITEGTNFFATMREEYAASIEAKRVEFMGWDNAKLDEVFGENRHNTREFFNSDYSLYNSNGFLVDFEKYPKYKATFEKRVTAMIDKYIASESKKLISHITKAFKKAKATTGKVETLSTGPNGIEFTITTDNGKTLSGYTTIAGGWNIQREHYRYLVTVG